MTTQPTEPGSDHFDEDGRSILDWARRLYPGGYHTNLAGQPIRQPVYDDPESAHLYPRCPHDEQYGNCGECAESDAAERQGDTARDGDHA